MDSESLHAKKANKYPKLLYNPATLTGTQTRGQINEKNRADARNIFK